MGFKKGASYRVFITTENPSGSIICTGDWASASTQSLVGPNYITAGIAPLGVFVSVSDAAASRSEIKNILSITPEWGAKDDEDIIFGQTRPQTSFIMQNWSLKIDVKANSRIWDMLYDGARYGVTGSGASVSIFDGSYTYPNETGYRLYVWDGNYFYVGYNAIISADGFSEEISPTGTTKKSITFKGGKWSASIPEGAIQLTQSQNIKQT